MQDVSNTILADVFSTAMSRRRTRTNFLTAYAVYKKEPLRKITKVQK